MASMKELVGSSLLQQPSLVPLPRFGRGAASAGPEEPTMNAPTLRKICRDHDLYSTPELNDKLYVHYKGSLSRVSVVFHLYLGFRKIEGLDEYKGLKVIYLEGNGAFLFSFC